MAREQRNEALQVNWLKQVKNSISKEAFRFSGFAQQVGYKFNSNIKLKYDLNQRFMKIDDLMTIKRVEIL